MIRLNCRPSLGSCLAVAAAGFLSGRWASAATPAALDAVLTYDADAACPARDQFLALLDKAIDPPDAARAPTGPDVRLRVTIRAATGGYHGSLEKLDRSGSSEPRVGRSPRSSPMESSNR